MASAMTGHQSACRLSGAVKAAGEAARRGRIAAVTAARFRCVCASLTERQRTLPSVMTEPVREIAK